MKLLLDECLPALFACDLIGHEVSTVDAAGLKGLENGDLLAAAGQRFDVLVTIDKGIQYQQNLNKTPDRNSTSPFAIQQTGTPAWLSTGLTGST